AQRGHHPILPTITTHIHSLSGPVAARYACCCRSPPSLPVVLTRSHWRVITYSRRKKAIVAGKYERPVDAMSMGKRSSLSGVIVCRWKAWKPLEGNKLEV
ncbi:unnamed protein product, partial [Tuber aestivum]